MINDRSRLIVRKASAGSGKTFTLVKEFIKMAFTCPENDLERHFGRILAITFTNKAANEMKERILKELDDIAHRGEDNSMAESIHDEWMAEYGREVLSYPMMMRYAQRVKNGILHNYSDLSVCTIDSFMHRIVKTFAHDLGLPMNFNVLLENEDLIQSAVDDLMATAHEEDDSHLTEMLKEFAFYRMEDGKSFNIEASIAELAKQLFVEGTEKHLKLMEPLTMQDFATLCDDWKKQVKDKEKALKGLGTAAMADIKNEGLTTNDFPQKGKGAGAHFAAMENGDFKQGNSYTMDYLTNGVPMKAKMKKEEQERVEALNRLRPTLLLKYSQSLPLMRQLNTLKAMLRNVYSTALLNKLNEHVGAESAATDQIHISEFNKQIAQVIEDEAVPFIYERVGNRYQHILIDEFQDTSRQQWLNLLPLVENAVSEGHTCLIVGDAKQAIYRFRKGDVKQFVKLPQVDYSRHGGIFGHPTVADVDTLKKNFRTNGTIVRFNNDLYKWIMESQKQELREIYLGSGPTQEADLVQEPKNDRGYVQISHEKEEGEMWEQIRREIRHQVDDMGYSYSDIYLLGRDKTALEAATAALSASRDGEPPIPMVSSESFLLKNSRVVQLMRAMLFYLLDPRDRAAALQALQILDMLGVTTHRYEEEMTQREERTNKHGKKIRTFAPIDLADILAKSNITLNCEMLRSMTLYDCVEEMLRIFGLGCVEVSYTTSLLNVITAWSKNHRQDLAEFLEWLDKKFDKLSSNSAQAKDAVTLMTIHKSKGLESKIVICALPATKSQKDSIWVEVPDKNSPLKTTLLTPGKESTEFDSQVFEEMEQAKMDDINVLYVATTRPERKLFVYCSKEPEEKKPERVTIEVEQDGMKVQKEVDRPEKINYQSLLGRYLMAHSQVESEGMTLTWRQEERDGFEVRALGEDITLEEEKKLIEEEKKKNGEKKKEEKKKPVVEQVEISNLSHERWNKRITIATQADKVFDTTSQEHIRRGELLHEVLSMMEDHTQAEQAVERYSATNDIDEDGQKSLKEQLRRLMLQEECARFFEPGMESIRECEMVIDGDIRRPDRVVLADGETWVVDFKTGKANDEHKTQVRKYCNAFREMGYPNVKGYLMYIQGGSCRVEEV